MFYKIVYIYISTVYELGLLTIVHKKSLTVW